MRFFVLLVFLTVLSFASDMAKYQNRAQALELSSERYWSLLLHMNADGVSEIDDPAFFLSPEGRHDASAELNATIAALLSDARTDDNATVCRFPARKAWLQERLGIESWPEAHCEAFDALIERMDPKSATMVFSSAHINSPASMFGHTFLRIDSSMQSKLLSYAVNYAARTAEDNGFIFALKGLFGGYPGFYSLLPYYEKLKEYSSTEQRDVWEYDLQISEAQLRQMVRHIWELNGIYSWYYFFDENCSYNLLWLIEIARPELHLHDRFSYHVVPPETVMVLRDAGLVTRTHYRPSKRTKLLAYEARLGAMEHADALALAHEGMAPSGLSERPYDEGSKRFVLEAAAELSEYYHITNELNQSEYAGRLHGILTARSGLGRGETLTVPVPQNPLHAHKSMRVSLQQGWREGRSVQYFGIRPAYHDLSDSDEGLLRGTQIEFLDLLGSYDGETARLEHATLLSIVSLAKTSAFFTPFSWRMKTGFERRFSDEKLAWGFSVGAGYAFGFDDAWGYGLVEPLVHVGDSARVGAAVSVGTLLYEAGWGKSVFEAQRRFWIAWEDAWKLQASQTLRMADNVALKAQYGFVETRERRERIAKIIIDYFF